MSSRNNLLYPVKFAATKRLIHDDDDDDDDDDDVDDDDDDDDERLNKILRELHLK